MSVCVGGFAIFNRIVLVLFIWRLSVLLSFVLCCVVWSSCADFVFFFLFRVWYFLGFSCIVFFLGCCLHLSGFFQWWFQRGFLCLVTLFILCLMLVYEDGGLLMLVRG